MPHLIKKFAEGSKLAYTQEIRIATAQTRDASKWRNQQLSMEAFVAKLADTVRTKETFEEYLASSKSDQDNIKDVGGFVGGLLKGGRRGKSDVQNRSILALDIDFGNPNTIDSIRAALPDTAYTIYSTHKHSPNSQRLRLIVYPDRPMLPAEYQAVMRKVAAQVDIELFDSTTYDINRLMYWPSTSSDAEFVFEHNDAPFLDVGAVLGAYSDWQDVTEWPVGSRENKSLSRSMAQQADPLKKAGIVGAFCRQVDIHEAMAITKAYKKEGKNRYTYLAGTTSNGVVIYDDKFAYSNHESDPAGGQTVNAFDLVRIHLYGQLDTDSRHNENSTQLPSYKAMVEYARGVDGVKHDLVSQGLSEATADDFELIEDSVEPDTVDTAWLATLQTDREGNVKTTFFNATQILRNDPVVCNRPAYNEMSYATEVGRSGDVWTDRHSFQIRRYIGQRYGCDFADSKIEQAIDDRAYELAFHPVQEYLSALEWDGVPRVDTVFIDWLAVPDSLYAREVGRCTLIAAVNRAMAPGHKFDQVTVLGGPQGIGKSTFIRMLGKSWYAELSSFDLKIAAEEMQGAWIMEMNEMSATNRTELEAQKAFISATETKVRLPYARRPIKMLRQTVFIATTNRNEYLKDSTGNRRWWPLECGISAGKMFDLAAFTAIVDQLWAEAYERWAMGETSLMRDGAQEEALAAQEKQRESDPWKGIIGEWLVAECDANRYDRTAIDEVMVPRDRACVVEIWQDCLGQKDTPKRQEANRIIAIMDSVPGFAKQTNPLRFGTRFGRQKGWVLGTLPGNQ
jgi:putative DNA primase/helicase